MEFDFSQIKAEFEEGRNIQPVEESSNAPFKDSHLLPCEVVLKGHWLEGETEEEGRSRVQNTASTHTATTTREEPSYSITLSTLSPAVTANVSGRQTGGETTAGFRCPSCTYTVDKLWKLRNHQKIHIGAVYRCSYCDFQTNVKRNLARHELNHAPTKRFICDECDYQNNSRVLFNKHKRSHLQQFKNSKFKCPICSFGSSERETWKQHVTSHERIRLHECQRCDYITTKLSDIKRHNLTHSKSEAPGVRCSKCNFTTSGTPNLTRHEMTAHNQPKRIAPDPQYTYDSHNANLTPPTPSHPHVEGKPCQCHECLRINYKTRLKEPESEADGRERRMNYTSCGFETNHKMAHVHNDS